MLDPHRSISLHSGWEFRKLDTGDWLPAQVPGCVHSDLFRNGQIPDPFYGCNEKELIWIEFADCSYRLEFDLGSEAPEAFKALEVFKAGHIDLVADGIDTVATLRLNGQVIAETRNMFVEHRIPVKQLLIPGVNTLEVLFHNPRAEILKRQPNPLAYNCDYIGGRQELRKQQCSFGWDWGPRLTTCGMWLPIRLECWSQNRIVDYRVSQTHSTDSCEVALQVEVAEENGDRLHATLLHNGAVVASANAALGQSLNLCVADPLLWWPNGQGEQPLYDLRIELLDGETVIDHREQPVAMCEIVLDQSADEWGTSFQFIVNGRPVFCKGANWVPAHSLVNEGKRLIPDLLDSAVEANMNMLRVWGGGIYEFDAFYRGCLERGLMIWQDFMFACALYPGDSAFIDEVRAEAECQVRRLAKYANIALWCGNNELEQLLGNKLREDENLRRDYEAIFIDLLPATLTSLAPGAAYISSSEHNPDDRYGDTGNKESGDAHYWGVWFLRLPISSYEDQYHRFFSEFGMQAYPHVETAATFTTSQNLFGPDMDNHQKNGGGNQIIFHYIAELFRFPGDYRATVYLSQIMQAFCIRFGIEHMRRNTPRTMGALYWQLNDCWPVASWSGIDFGGRWKALHYAAKRFFAPLLVSVKVIGKEEVHGSTNHLLSTVEAFEIHTVFDGFPDTTAQLDWQLWSVADNAVIDSASTPLSLSAGESRLALTLNVQDHLKRFTPADLVLRTRLSSADHETSVNTTFLTTPKRITFQSATIGVDVSEGAESGTFEITLHSDVIAYQVYVNLRDAIPHRVSDNFCDLFPGEKKALILCPGTPMSLDEVRNAITTYSYVDSYEA